MTTTNDPTPNPHLDALLAEAGWVLKLAKRLAQDQAAAEDIAQSTLALALERRPAVEGGLRPWLAKVVGRLARRRVLSDARRQAREGLVVSARSTESDASDEVLMRFELQQDLARRVDALPERYRRILIYRYYEGLSVAEIAVATGSTPSTIRSQLARGLLRIRLQYSNGSDSRGVLGAFLIAAGSSTDSVSRTTAKLLVMQTSTKVVAATAAAFLIVVAVISSDLVGLDSFKSDSGGTLTTRDELVGVKSGKDYLVNAPAGAGVRMAVERVAVSGDSQVSTPAGSVVPVVSTLHARILDENSMPLVGGTLSSILPDGQPRGAKSITRSDNEGRVVLELDDDSMRKWREQVHDMIFAVAAEGHATRFVIKRPILHGDTDLGDVRLGPGRAIVGRAVDAAGRGVAGAVLLAGASETLENPSELRTTGPEFGETRPRAVGGADGRFELAGISSKLIDGRAPSVRLWVHAPGRMWTITEPIAMTSGGRVDVGDVLLEEIPSALRLEGVVVGPDGYPAAGARIDFMSMGRPMGGHVNADTRGYFMVIPKDDSLVQLVARDAEGEFGISPALTAQRGDSIELKLSTNRRVISVTVIDTEGEPIGDAHLRPVFENGLVPGEDWVYTDKLGRVDIVVPGQSFSVWVRKAGYGSEHSAPLEPQSVADKLTITMSGGRKMIGRVLAYGEPVVGARVAVTRRLEGLAAMVGDFPNRYTGGVPAVVTDSDGRFVAALKLDWSELGAVARKDGLAAGEATVDQSPGVDVRDIEIHMTKGGAIEGIVLPPPDMNAEGIHVGASRGDGNPISTITDVRGRYRFEGLTPGDWRVEGRFREVTTQTLATSRRPDVMDPKWNVIVVDRETVRFDVDMRSLLEVKIQGQLRIDGAVPPPGWKVELIIPPHERSPVEVGVVALDTNGRFTMLSRSTHADLRLVGPVRGGATVEMVREIQFDGPRFRWEGTLRTVPVEERVEGSFERARFVRGDDDEGDRELTIVPLDEHGLLVARVPVGRSSLQVPAKSETWRSAWDLIRMVEIR